VSGGIRLSLSVPGAGTDALLELAPRADHWNLAALWLGDPRSRAANSADSYVTTVAGALGAVTHDLRLGLFLTIAQADQVVRIAEDVGVGDQACGGRLELGFVAPEERRDEWAERVASLLGAWNAWRLPGREETVAVIPGPAQPVVPTLVLGEAALADRLGAGRIVIEGDGGMPAPQDAGRLVPRRTILVIEPDAGDGGLVAWVGRPSAYQRVLELREQAAAAGASEILLSVPTAPSEPELAALGTVLVPALRASARDVRAITTDAWTWITAKAHLHAPPAAPRSATPGRS
jgi:alkanesulfonate monooxygenase SsuD/methylene tetrahydromethanopterin reductase-like flavin-dependent oxidoreductase (luciferase family)